MTFEKAMERVLSGHKNCKVTSVMDIKDNFVVAIEPNNWNQDEILMDPFFAVNKQTGKVSEWTPIMDPEGFKQALAHGIVYKEGDPIPEEKPDVLKHSEGMTVDELYHHGIKGQKWGIRRFQPYLPGSKVKGGKEVGKATKVKQRGSIVEHFKAKQAEHKKAAAVKKAQATRKANIDYEAAKKKAIESGTAEDLAKFKGKLTNEEYSKAFMRLQNEKKLADMVAANEKTVWDTIDKGANIVNRLSGYMGVVANAKTKYDAMNDALHKKENDDKKEKAEKEKNKFLTNIDSITELNEGVEKYNVTPQQYQAAMNILANKKMNRVRFGTKEGDQFKEDQDFEDQNKKAAREQAAKEQADRTRWDAEQNWKQYQKRQAKAAWESYKKDRDTPKDGTWRPYDDGDNSGSSSSKSTENHRGGGFRGERWGTRPSPAANQLLLTMKDSTPSSSSVNSGKRVISGFTSPGSKNYRVTSQLEFGGSKVTRATAQSSKPSSSVEATRRAVEATKRERDRQKEIDKKRKARLG